MAISGVSGYTPPIAHQAAHAQRVQQPKQDVDGDNDGSRAGEVEKQESAKAVSPGSTLGTIINVKA